MTACTEQYNAGEFETESNLMPEARTDAPLTPTALIASYDDYCDKVELAWTPTPRTTGYDVYKDGVLIAQNLTDTSYVDTEALTVDTEYKVYSKNVNGTSETELISVGRMAATPPTPVNFTATDGVYEAKVDLSWEEANFAQYYKIYKNGELLADNVEGTTFSDNENAPEVATEYSVVAVSVCGESPAAIETGYCDPLVAFRVPFDENFEGFTPGVLATVDDFMGYRPRFQFVDAPNANGTVEIKSDNTKYLDLDVYNDKASIQLILPQVELLVGESYTISFDLKAPVGVNPNLHMGTDVSGDGMMGKYIDNYFLPTLENTKNGNAFGVVCGGSGEWKSYSFDFPATGVETKDPDPDPVALGWTLRTIEEGEQNPIIQIQMWKKNGTYAIDNIKIELK